MRVARGGARGAALANPSQAKAPQSEEGGGRGKGAQKGEQERRMGTATDATQIGKCVLRVLPRLEDERSRPTLSHRPRPRGDDLLDGKGNQAKTMSQAIESLALANRGDDLEANGV